MLRRLAVAALLCSLAGLAFWLLTDFGSFHPPASLSLSERWYCLGLTAAGPFALLALGEQVTSLPLAIAIQLVVVAALLALSVARRRSQLARCAGYLGVILWFFFGSAVPGLWVT